MTAALAQAQTAIAQPDPAPHCPLCDAAPGTPAWTAPDGVRSVHRCAGCGLTYTWPRIEQEFEAIPERYYYNSFEWLDLQGPSFLFNDVSTALGRRIALGLGRAGKLPSILDAGCGAGHVLLDFRAHGWTVEGVDPWRVVTAIGRKYYRLTIQDGKLETAAIAPESKDAVLALDVLQFTAEPKAFLAAARTALAPGGLLYLTVPNHDSTASRRDGWNHQHFSPHTYITYFTAETLRRMLEESGFYRIQIILHDGPQQDDRIRVLARRAVPTALEWPDLAEEVSDAELPPLDRQHAVPKRLTREQEFWRENGYLILPGLIPDAINEAYCAVRRRHAEAAGWSHATPYLEVPEIRDLCLYPPLVEKMTELMGEPMGLHLNLTGWISTERDWHQDDYLNPPEVNGHYIAAWTALDAIQPDAGPFEFVPGSHRWPIIRQRKVLALLGHKDGTDPYWPAESERILTPFFEREIMRRGAAVERFLGQRGDVLLWHARLLHRGSLPLRAGAERRSMIAHYSALTHRHDMPVSRQHEGGGWYFMPWTQPDAPAERPSLLQRLASAIRPQE